MAAADSAKWLLNTSKLPNSGERLVSFERRRLSPVLEDARLKAKCWLSLRGWLTDQRRLTAFKDAFTD